MDARQPGFDLTEGPRALLEGLGLEPDGGSGARRSSACATATPGLALLVEPLLGVTLAPTIISASPKINVIPRAPS